MPVIKRRWWRTSTPPPESSCLKVPSTAECLDCETNTVHTHYVSTQMAGKIEMHWLPKKTRPSGVLGDLGLLTPHV